VVDTSRPPGVQAGTVVVTFPGEIDMANATGVGEELTAAFDAGAAVVVADMSGTRFCDTSGIHALVAAHKRAQASGAGFRVVVRPGVVRRVLEIVCLDSVLALYPRLDAALLDGDQDPQPDERPGG
jgi:anti-sigma B factor antagonist